MILDLFIIILCSAAAAKSLQSCPTLCDVIDRSPPGSPVPGILQARTLEWVAISFSNAWKWKVKVKSESEVAQSCLTLSNPMNCSLPGSPVHGFSRQEYWSELPLPSPILCSQTTKTQLMSNNKKHTQLDHTPSNATKARTYSKNT